MTREELYAKARLLPASPGVYLMKNSAGRVIYVGKSKALCNRVGSYFAAYSNHVGKTARMVASVHDFEVYHTATELEALVLENQFIKQYMPRYNIKLKDSKGYPYIKVGTGDYPKITVVNERSGEGSFYGPYASHVTAKNIVHTAKNAFRLPECNKSFPADCGKGRPCLNYHIGKCCGVCKGNIKPDEYKALIAGAKRLLAGDCTALAKSLEAEMIKASEDMEFERAARYRDSMRAVLKIKDKQHIVASPAVEADVFGVYSDDAGSAVIVLMIRNGAICDRESFFFGADELVTPASIASLIRRFYELSGFVPKEIWLGYDLGEEAELLEQYLGKTKLLFPQRGDKRALTSQATNNAKEQLLHKRAESERHNTFLVSLASFLSLEVVPERIESYDISNSGEDYITAGMVVMKGGRFSRKDYRSFNMKELDGQNDLGALTEALRRRFSHLDDGESWEAPDLILMDGGVGQVNAAKAVLDEYALSIPVLGMVKDEHHKTRTLTDGENEFSLHRRQDIFVFLYKLQEEVHRYALSRMDARRRKAAKTSVLTQIKGVGEAKAIELLRRFGGLAELKKASPEQISEVKGITPELAERIADFLANM